MLGKLFKKVFPSKGKTTATKKFSGKKTGKWNQKRSSSPHKRGSATGQNTKRWSGKRNSANSSNGESGERYEKSSNNRFRDGERTRGKRGKWNKRRFDDQRHQKKEDLVSTEWKATFENGELASRLILKEKNVKNTKNYGPNYLDLQKKTKEYKKSTKEYSKREKLSNLDGQKIDGHKRKTSQRQKSSSSAFSTSFPSAPSAHAKNWEKSSLNQKTEEETLKENAPATEEEKFENIGITNEDLIEKLKEQNITKAMPVQQKIIPLAMQNKNILCSSPTGSGKTLTFALPILQKHKQKEIYQVLVLSPTREIALQSKKVFNQLLGKSAKEKVGLIIGGVDMLEQKQILRNYPPILIATPGRLIDMMNQGLVWLNYTNILAIDEIDRMFDLGFEEDIERIFRELTKKDGQKDKNINANQNKSIDDLQIWMFTATLLPSIEKMIDKYVPKYEMVLIEKKMKINDNIDHCMISIKNETKFDAFIKIVNQWPEEKIIVFFNTIDETLNYTKKMKYEGFKNCVALHSKKRQSERERSLNEFRHGKKNILFATNVASRGIDVPNIGIVINFSIPFNSEEYIHRIGRTGRAHARGKAITFIEKSNQKAFAKLKKDIKVRFQIQTLQEFCDGK